MGSHGKRPPLPKHDMDPLVPTLATEEQHLPPSAEVAGCATTPEGTACTPEVCKAEIRGILSEQNPGLPDSLALGMGEGASPQSETSSSSLASGQLKPRATRLPKETGPFPEVAANHILDDQMLDLSKETCKAQPGTPGQVTSNSSPDPETSSNLRVPQLFTSSRTAEAALPDDFSALLPPGVAVPIPKSQPRCSSRTAAESATSGPEQQPLATLPKLLPSSPVRRCLSSSAAAISRYIAASCISHSLAKKNGGPQPKELPASCRPLSAGWAVPRLPANPLALLPRGAPKAQGNPGRAEVLVPRDSTQCFGSGSLSSSPHRALEHRIPFSSASEPNSRVQSPSSVKPWVCSSPPASTFTPVCVPPYGQPPAHIASPVPLNPALGPSALPQFGQRSRGHSLPNCGLRESLATNGDQKSLCGAIGSTCYIPSPPIGSCLSSHELGSIKWPNVPGLRSKYANTAYRPSFRKEELECREGCPQLDTPTTMDTSRCAEKNYQQKASYSTTVNIQIGGSGRIASFSNAQVSLTHPLLATPEQLSFRKVNSSTSETLQKT